MKSDKLALLPDDTIKRLRVARQTEVATEKAKKEAEQAEWDRVASEDRKKGKEAVREWALQLVDFSPLKSVASVNPDASHRLGLLFAVTHIVDRTFSPFDNGESEFWISLVGAGRPSNHLLIAFIEGARELLEQIEAAA